MNMGQDTGLWNRHIFEQPVQLVVVANREEDVAGIEAFALIGTGGFIKHAQRQSEACAPFPAASSNSAHRYSRMAAK